MAFKKKNYGKYAREKSERGFRRNLITTGIQTIPYAINLTNDLIQQSNQRQAASQVAQSHLGMSPEQADAVSYQPEMLNTLLAAQGRTQAANILNQRQQAAANLRYQRDVDLVEMRGERDLNLSNVEQIQKMNQLRFEDAAKTRASERDHAEAMALQAAKDDSPLTRARIAEAEARMRKADRWMPYTGSNSAENFRAKEVGDRLDRVTRSIEALEGDLADLEMSGADDNVLDSYRARIKDLYDEQGFLNRVWMEEHNLQGAKDADDWNDVFNTSMRDLMREMSDEPIERSPGIATNPWGD